MQLNDCVKYLLLNVMPWTVKQYEPDNKIMLFFEIWFNEQVEQPLWKKVRFCCFHWQIWVLAQDCLWVMPFFFLMFYIKIEEIALI